MAEMSDYPFMGEDLEDLLPPDDWEPGEEEEDWLTEEEKKKLPKDSAIILVRKRKLKWMYHEFKKEWGQSEEEQELRKKIHAMEEEDEDFEPIDKQLEELLRSWNYRNNRVGRWGMRRYDFLKETDPDLLTRLVDCGNLTPYLNIIDRLCQNRELMYGYLSNCREEMKARCWELIETPTLEVETTREDLEAEIRTHNNWHYMFAKEHRPNDLPKNFRLGRYAMMRWNFLLEERPEELWHTVQQGTLEPELIEIQERMDDLVEKGMETYLKAHPVPPRSNPYEFAGYMNMTKMLVIEALQGDILFS